MRSEHKFLINPLDFSLGCNFLTTQIVQKYFIALFFPLLKCTVSRHSVKPLLLKRKSPDFIFEGPPGFLMFQMLCGPYYCGIYSAHSVAKSQKNIVLYDLTN